MAQSNYGTVYTARQVAQQLRETNRDVSGDLTWQTAEQSALVGMQKQESALSQSYREATASAYDTYLKNKRAITSSDIIGESQGQLVEQQQQALTEAYNTYQSSYLEGQQAIEQNYMQQIANIDSALMQQAEMTVKYANYHGDYYDYLVENYGDALSSQELWKNRMMVDVTDEQGKATGEKRLATWNELKSRLYDEEGNLTLFGVDVMDQLENAELGQGMETWGEFLATTDADVLDWAESYNPYNFTVGGSNAATFRTMTGRLSTDAEYSFLERFGGLSSDQVDELFSRFTDNMKTLSEYSSEDKKNKGKDIVKDVKGYVSDLSTFAESLGIDKDLNQAFEAAGIKSGLSGLSDVMEQYLSGTTSMGANTGQWFASFAADTASFAAMGSALGSVIPGVGNAVGAIVGTIFGAIWGAVDASMRVDENRQRNKEMANKATEAYKAAINQMVMYGHQQQQAAQERFVSGIL